MKAKKNIISDKNRVFTYKLLWLDDRSEQQGDFVKLAAEHDVELINFRTFDEGFDDLESNLGFYDGVLLDTTFFIDKLDESKQEKSNSVTALSIAIGRINQLSSKKRIPYFIFTSNEEYEKNEVFVSTYGKFYRKYVPEDMSMLLSDIVHEVSSQADAYIRNKYSDIFEVFTDEYLGTAHRNEIFEVLQNFERVDSLINASLYFNPLRKIFESMLYSLYQFGILPPECFKNEGEPNIMWCVLYLSGKEVRMGRTKYLKPRFQILPNLIKNNVLNIVSYTNIASHNEVVSKNVRNDISELRSIGVDSPYLLYSLTFQMLDVILWLKAHVDNNALRKIR